MAVEHQELRSQAQVPSKHLNKHKVDANDPADSSKSANSTPKQVKPITLVAIHPGHSSEATSFNPEKNEQQPTGTNDAANSSEAPNSTPKQVKQHPLGVNDPSDDLKVVQPITLVAIDPAYSSEATSSTPEKNEQQPTGANGAADSSEAINLTPKQVEQHPVETSDPSKEPRKNKKKRSRFICCC